MNENQSKVLEFAKKNDISNLSYREIARQLKFKSPQIVVHHLEQLKKKGLIYFDKNKKHKIAKLKGFVVDSLFNIPIVGSANCGPAQELAEENIQGFIKISKKLFNVSKPDNLIAIRAVGNSLNQAKIKGSNVEEGDYLIVDCNKRDPENGDYVLSVIDGSANFKKFYKDDKEIRLISESKLDIPPIILHEEDISASNYLVNGVVERVVKN